ncbi:CysQ [Prochlorococcus marinus str. MIT 9515]|uniref:inositol-phosphate phosphatase n=1 Tax=Prochlorococcus marinus (strain MIT 9515) TaxID=167542 RepID=A2BXR0_PROM5|nr:3'(2'),5'-bisphosphate nucleotidase CysQ [Prochlorococcus marinus]ABM72571.1 CysQ [Prochlorococcus marinus str. MIT 9515]
MVKLPEGVDINNLIDDLRIFSWEAADILLQYSQILKKSDYKKNILKNGNEKDPVTKADLDVNDLILKRMQSKYPSIGWKYLSEENAKADPNNCDINSDWVWILDPLDGTKDFLQGTDNYAMHFALNFKNKPFLGVVLIPERDELWISNGVNVWCDRRQHINLKLNSFPNKSLCEMTLVTSKNHSNPTLMNLIDKICFKNVVTMGSIGCKIASIIRGESDIYISLSLPDKSSPKDWDFAAPEVILKTAGGAVTNLENEELCYEKANFDQAGIIIASNNKNMHSKICFQIKEIIKKYDIYPFIT